MDQLREHLTDVAKSNSTVLLTGETGTGKDLAARFIHDTSLRWDKPFEPVNCAAIPENLFESELFGYAPGTFTGALSKGKSGRFATANGGTIFLDEVTRLSLSNQGKMLQVIENKLIQRLGEEQWTKLDARIIAATNIDLAQAVAENKFLPDLYYRLNVIPIPVPSLKERAEDIPLLLDFFVNIFKKDLPESDFYGFSDEAMEFFMTYKWPGNVRELRNIVEYLMNTVHGREITMSDIPPHFTSVLQKPLTFNKNQRVIRALEDIEIEQIHVAMQTFGQTTEGKLKAAQQLGISLSTLYRKISKTEFKQRREGI